MKITIDDAGLTRPRQDEIQADLDAHYRAIFGQDIDLSASSVDGQLIGVLSEMVSDVVQLLEDVFVARSIPGARGAALSRLVKLIGINRVGSSYSIANVNFTGTVGTVIPDGSLVDTTDVPAAHFQTVGDVTIGLDGTGVGVARATTTGTVYAPSGTLTKIITPIAGWATVTNPVAAIAGSDQETDAALRVRHAASTALDSKSMVDSIYAAIANLPGVSQVVIFENRTGTPMPRSGGTPLPANAIQVVVNGGVDADIASAIFQKASAGVTLIGASSASVTDSQGVAQLIKFDRPRQISVYNDVILRVSTTASLTSSLVAAIKKAVVDYGNASARVGRAVSFGALWAPISQTITAAFNGDSMAVAPFQLELGTSFPPIVQTDLAMPYDGIPAWDISRVRVLYLTSDPIAL